MKNRNLTHSDNWATPKALYDELNNEFAFDFDPCPLNEGAITPDKDGLLIEWGQRNFINPPYSRKLKEAFVKRAVEESKKGKLCVCLLPVSTSTKLFHEVIKPNANEIRFLKGRVKFLGKNTKGEYVETKAGMHDSMVVIFGAFGKNNLLSQADVSGSLPTEEQVLKTIFDCVFIRGIELEDYKWNFTNEQSGLYDALVKLFKGNDANRLLAAAASWWDNLTTFKRELYIGRHYSDDTPTPDKINALYKMYNDWSSEDLEQVSSCR